MAVFRQGAVKATREKPAVGALTGRKDPPPAADRGHSVKSLPNVKVK